MKGVSAIIATILMLIITIGLAGTAYVYISGVMTGRTATTISALDATCVGGDATIVVSNDGTVALAAADVAIYEGTTALTADCTIPGISPHTTGVITCSPALGFAPGAHEVLITGPANSARIQFYC